MKHEVIVRAESPRWLSARAQRVLLGCIAWGVIALAVIFQFGLSLAMWG